MGENSKINSIQIFIVAAFFLLLLILTVLCVGFMVKYGMIHDVIDIETISYWKEHLPIEQSIWYDNGIEELQFALELVPPEENAQNIIIYVANGISPDALAAVRFTKNITKNNDMSWDLFPYMARLKNSCSYDLCNAATVATALFGGVMTNFGVGGVDSAVAFGNCTAASNETHHVKSILEQAQELGMRTGMITEGRITAPFVAPLYGHTADSSYECDSSIPEGELGADCIDLAQQLVESKTAQNLNVIMGGGRQTLVTNTPINEEHPIDEGACRAKGKNRNIVRDWVHVQLAKNRTFAIAYNTEDLEIINGNYVDYTLGVFANGDISSSTAAPELQDMVVKSLDILNRDNNGFMLFVNTIVKANKNVSTQIEELVKLNKVIEETFKSPGYSQKNILTLVVFTHGIISRANLNKNTVTKLDNPVNKDKADEAESGESFVGDTVVFAQGPKSYLFHGVREETFMTYALSYIMKLDQ